MTNGNRPQQPQDELSPGVGIGMTVAGALLSAGIFAYGALSVPDGLDRLTGRSQSPRQELFARHGHNANYIRRDLNKGQLLYNNRPYTGKPNSVFTGDDQTLDTALAYAEREALKRVDEKMGSVWVPRYLAWLEENRLPEGNAHFSAWLRYMKVDTTEMQYDAEQEVLRELSDPLGRMDKRKVLDAVGLKPDLK
jgi:hypothetical protein